VGFGRAAELLSRERVASKRIVAAVREPLTRAAATPLMCCSDPAVVTATEQLLNALSNVEDTARLETAPAAFGRAVDAATAPRLPWGRAGERLRDRRRRGGSRRVGNRGGEACGEALQEPGVGGAFGRPRLGRARLPVRPLQRAPSSGHSPDEAPLPG
jgi:hypothetical protein